MVNLSLSFFKRSRVYGFCILTKSEGPNTHPVKLQTMWPLALVLIGLSIIVFLTPTQDPNEVPSQRYMAIPANPSPLGPHKARCSSPATSTSDPIAARIQQHIEARMARHYAREPWLKKTPLQTSQMVCIRRKFCKIQSCFYWRAIRDKVMGEENRGTNRYFLDPLMGVVANTNNPAHGHVAERETMDFARMTRKWESGTYFGDSISIVTDFHLMVFNAEANYPPGHRVHDAATRLRAIFEEECSDEKWSVWMNNAVTIVDDDGLYI